MAVSLLVRQRMLRWFDYGSGVSLITMQEATISSIASIYGYAPIQWVQVQDSFLKPNDL